MNTGAAARRQAMVGDLFRQGAQVLNRYLLWDLIKPLARCISCNGLLEPMTRKMCQDICLSSCSHYRDLS